MIEKVLINYQIENIPIEVRTYEKGVLLHSPLDACEGLFFVNSGCLRVYILSPEGREVTLYRLQEGELCLFSASCVFQNINFDIYIEAEIGSTIEVISIAEYRKLQDNPAFVNYVNDIMARRMNQILQLLNDILWNRMDQRILNYLKEEAQIQESRELTITHERIANHLGTAREVVSRVLKYLETNQQLVLKRGKIQLLDES